MAAGTSTPGELLADVREGFAQLESAISTADPQRCRPFVSDQLYQEIAAMVHDLSARGHRRIHGSFEILDAARLGGELPNIRVRIHAVSSIMEVDSAGDVVVGSGQLMSWSQDLTAAQRPALVGQPQWIIGELDQMSIEGVVTGPASPPMDPARAEFLETEGRRREREVDYHIAMFRANVVNIINIGGAA